MKFYLFGTAFITLVLSPNMKSLLQDPNEQFDQYILPFFYLSPEYQTRFAQNTTLGNSSANEGVLNLVSLDPLELENGYINLDDE